MGVTQKSSQPQNMFSVLAVEEVEKPVMPTKKVPEHLKNLVLCKYWLAGECRHGELCNYAHGVGELRKRGQQQSQGGKYQQKGQYRGRQQGQQKGQ